MQLFKRIVGVFFCGIVLLCLWWTGMNATGYCHAQGRYLSAEEKIRSAARFVLDGYPPAISKKIEVTQNGKTQLRDYWYRPENPIKYKDVDEFLRLNPDCCQFSMRTGEGRRPGYFDRIFGYVATYVLIEYKVIPADNSGDVFNKGSTAVAVTNCGRAWSGL